MSYSAIINTAPTSYPLGVPEVQQHLRITGQSDEITRLIIVATGVVQRYLSRVLITQTWDVYYDYWCSELKLPYPPLQSVTSVKYYDEDGVLQTLDSSNYWITKDSPAEIVRAYSVTYPTLQAGRPQAIKITYVAGYGVATAVPEEIKQAMKLIITDLYENKGTVVLGSVAKIPDYITSLIHSYKIYNF